MRKFRELILVAVLCVMPAVVAAGAAHTAVADVSRTVPVAASAVPDARAAAGAAHTVTFVNRSGKKLWIGSTVNKREPDGNSRTSSRCPSSNPGSRRP
ncbi:hypothetical protein [Streptomyces spinosirectus]